MPRDASEPVESRIFRRRFRDRDVIESLDGMDLDAVWSALDKPRPLVTLIHARPQGYWSPGRPRPALADDDPAVMQAVGRCASSRVVWDKDHPFVIDLTTVHPRRCAWCDYPSEELLMACDWATVTSRFVLSEVITWSNDMGQTYTRSGRADEYDNPAWRAFWALPDQARSARIRAAQYPEALS